MIKQEISIHRSVISCRLTVCQALVWVPGTYSCSSRSGARDILVSTCAVKVMGTTDITRAYESMRVEEVEEPKGKQRKCCPLMHMQRE